MPTSGLVGQIPQCMLVWVPAEALMCTGKFQLSSESSFLVDHLLMIDQTKEKINSGMLIQAHRSPNVETRNLQLYS